MAVSGIGKNVFGVFGLRHRPAMRQNDDVGVHLQCCIGPFVGELGALLEFQRRLGTNGTASRQAEMTDNDVSACLRHGFGIEAEILTSSCGRPTIVPIRGAPHIASTKGE